MPMARAIRIEVSPTSMAMRLPYTTRESWSRPSSSVPNQWAADGDCVVLARFWALGS
jgi:hypothetical protein